MISNDLDPEQEKRRLVAVLAPCVLGQRTCQPVLLMVEDVHGSAPTSLAFLR
jgi:hypothetical protein